jgi:signal transduction histidine kinase
MNKPTKVLWSIVCLSLLTVAGSFYICRVHLSSIERNWTDYQKQQLLRNMEFMQNRFSSLERNSFAILDDILGHTCVAENLARWQGVESRQRIFDALLAFPLPASEYRRGIAIYNQRKQCMAWRDWVFNLATEWLDRALKGNRFSVIAYSEERVYTVLCTFVPVPAAEHQELAGVLVAFLPLDFNYPLATRYIKSRSLEKEMSEKCQLPQVQIRDINTANTATTDGWAGVFTGINHEAIAKVAITPLSKERVLAKIAGYYDNFRKLLAAFLSLFALFFILYSLNKATCPGFFKCLAGIAITWIMRKYIFVVLDFSPLVFPSMFRSAEIFYSLFLGEQLSGTLADMILTMLAVLLSTSLWVWWMPVMHPPRQKWLHYPLAVLQAVVTIFLVAAGYRLITSFIHALIKICSAPQFSFINLLPSLPGLTIYGILFLLGLSVVLFYAWLIRQLTMLLPARAIYVCAALILSVIIAVDYFLFPALPYTPVFSITCLLGAAWCLNWKVPGRIGVRHILMCALLAGALYPVAYQAARQKMRDTVEYRTREDHQHFVRDIIESSLETFVQDNKLIKAFEEKKRNIAFLLWANSPLSTQGVENIEVWVYAKAKNYQVAQKESIYPHRILATERDKVYYLLSEFSLNMPTSQWYYPLLYKIVPEERQILQSIPGYGNEGRNILFRIASVPITNSDGQQIGFVAILSRYQKIISLNSLPEVFLPQLATYSQWEALLPLSMAYFEGHTMLDTNNPDLAKSFRPQAQVLDALENQQNKSIWVEETIEGRAYDNLYFRFFPQPVAEVTSDDTAAGARRIGMLGYILPTSLPRIFYFIQFFFTGSVCLLLPFWLYRITAALLQHGRYSLPAYLPYEQKILLAFLLISGIPVLVMGILSKEKAVAQISESYVKNLKECLDNAERALREECFIPFASEVDAENSIGEFNAFCQKWGERNSRILNIYLGHRLCATNRPEFFQTELLSLRIPGEAFFHLMLRKKDIYIALESLADYTFVVGYKALASPQDKRQVVGTLAIPMIYQHGEVQRKIAEMITTIFAIYLAIFLLVVIVGILLAHQITRPLAKLMQGTHRVSAGELDFEIAAHSRDEFGELVVSFNRMTKDLKISREKLILAQKEAAWREMARQIAHEIKNPLTPMKLAAQHIFKAYRDKSDKFGQILEKGVNTIVNAIDSLSRTASSFSEFAKFIKLSPSPHILAPILQECVDLFVHYRQQNIEITTDIHDNLPSVQTDAYHLKRVLINVLTNAVQAIENEGHIRLTCSLTAADKVTITVQDDGCGIPEHIKPHLFQPNFSTKSHGSGLGLAICKHAIDQMGGAIAIDSKEGVGTQVTIELPVAETNN